MPTMISSCNESDPEILNLLTYSFRDQAAQAVAYEDDRRVRETLYDSSNVLAVKLAEMAMNNVKVVILPAASCSNAIEASEHGP